MPPKKFRSVKRKKRKGFHGKKAWEIHKEKPVSSEQTPQGESSKDNNLHLESQNPGSSSSSDQKESKERSSLPDLRNISTEKLLNSSFGSIEEKEGSILTRSTTRKLGLTNDANVSEACGFKLQDATLLSEGISKACICSSCRLPNSQLKLYQDNKKRDGLSEQLFLLCSECGTRTLLNTSRRLGGIGGGSLEVNRRSVLASHQWGLAGLSKFCAGMDLPPPVTKKAYNDHLINIEKQSISNAEKLMCDAAERLKHITEKEHPENIHILEDGHVVANVSVSVDGTWQKRGHSSKMGVVFVISVRTGEILDYVVKSLVCQECTAHQNWDKDGDDYLEWKEEHKEHCQINHVGSSESMETNGAVEIFLRSIDKRGLRYTLFVGDGDSSCYGTVKEALKDVYCVEKEECVGHVQKRMGSALRTFKKDHKGRKLADGKTVGGKGRLTDKVIDKIQNYYGNAIRRNAGDLKQMKNDIWAIYHHMIRDDSQKLEVQHKLCPKSSDTWCKFWQDKTNNTSNYNESSRLPEIFRTELKPLFTRLSDDDLLGRCLRGLTQNQNEAVNGILWAKCPKNKFCGRRRIVTAVCETIGTFNTGAASKAVLMESCGVRPGSSMLKALRKEDKARIQSAAYKVSKKYRERRQALRSKKKAKADKQSYSSGSFGLSAKPEIKPKKSRKRKKETNHVDTSASNNVVVTFVEPVVEVVHVAPKKVRI